MLYCDPQVIRSSAASRGFEDMKISLIIALWMLLLPGHTFVVCAQKDKASKDKAGLASQFEKGDISEIKNLKRVFVSAESPRQLENITKALKKYQGIEVVDVPTDAEFVVAYTIEKHVDESPFSVQGAPPALNGRAIGVLLVYLPQQSGRNRRVWETRTRYLNYAAVAGVTREWELPLEKSMTGKFIKALKKARGEK
jgi:hypothetical protein